MTNHKKAESEPEPEPKTEKKVSALDATMLAVGLLLSALLVLFVRIGVAFIATWVIIMNTMDIVRDGLSFWPVLWVALSIPALIVAWRVAPKSGV